jgi:hypothetical protein
MIESVAAGTPLSQLALSVQSPEEVVSVVRAKQMFKQNN